MKYFLIAGEASGDTHAADLINAIKKEDNQASFIGLGGEKMENAGCNLLQTYKNMAFMGYVDVLSNLGKIKDNFRIAEQGLKNYQPDVLILIDYPSFNLKIAEFCKKNLPNTKIAYYIPPKIWAWKTWRVHKIAKYADKILGIFPFETDFYAKYGYKCEYAGNPTMKLFAEKSQQYRKEIVAILPGSRKHEIEKCLPKMLEAARIVCQNNYSIHVAKAPGIDEEFYLQYLNEEILRSDTHQLLQEAKAGIVNSGTATLEAAVLDCPQVAVYHVACGRFLGLIRPLVFKIPHFTLVNIIPQKEVIKEMIAYLFTTENIVNELQNILQNEDYRHKMLDEYAKIRKILGTQNAAENAAKAISKL